jgi:hypothetical protein
MLYSEGELEPAGRIMPNPDNFSLCRTTALAVQARWMQQLPKFLAQGGTVLGSRGKKKKKKKRLVRYHVTDRHTRFSSPVKMNGPTA